MDQFWRVTGTCYDKEGNQVYFYRTTDGTFWDRVHFPQKFEETTAWPSEYIYVRITQDMFEK
jgi:hypothetical protein